MKHVFLSYSHSDSAFVELLHDSLELGGRRIWLDVKNIRGGQIIDREVGIEIDSAAVFIPIVSEHFNTSSWLYHELARAVSSRIAIVPVVYNGVVPPVIVSAFNQIRIHPPGENMEAAKLLDVVRRINSAIGYSRPADYDEKRMDSSDDECDDEYDDIEDLELELIGTRWSWCENGNFKDEGMWIEFGTGGRLKRSWRSDPAKWEATENGFVIYKPHVLLFDIHAGTFQAAVADPDVLQPERSGLRLNPSRLVEVTD